MVCGGWRSTWRWWRVEDGRGEVVGGLHLVQGPELRAPRRAWRAFPHQPVDIDVGRQVARALLQRQVALAPLGEEGGEVRVEEVQLEQGLAGVREVRVHHQEQVRGHDLCHDPDRVLVRCHSKGAAWILDRGAWER